MRKVLLMTALFYATTTLAADPVASTAPAAQPNVDKLQAVLGGQKPDSVEPTAIPGLYEVITGGQIFYLSADGRYAVQGDVLDLDSRENLTENRRNALRGDAIKAINESEMVVFAPTENPVKHTITVFTDIDCGYCRRMHGQMAEYNKEGIEIRYMMFPRAGIGSESYDKAVSVWCADDRQAAMTKAKAGEGIETKTCENPIQAQFELGQKLGIRGTPSMILEDGEMLPGYVPPTRLAQLLAESSEEQPKAASQP